MFEYTEHRPVNSSALTDLYYNKDKRAVAVVTHEGNVYAYAGVSKEVFNVFANAASVGNYYATVIKRYYGPGQHLGYEGDAGLVKAGENATVGTPKGLTYADDAEVDGKPVGASSGPHVNFYTLGDNTAGRIVPATNTNASFVQHRRHEVVFTIDGSTEQKTFDTFAYGVSEAVQNLKSLTTALDLNVRVVKVVTYFG